MKDPQATTVVVGMSGGVDSSVSALLLKEQGYQVIGMFMKNWDEKDPDGTCRSQEDYDDVMRVCDQIGIPCYTVNFCQEYLDNVFADFLEEIQQGQTPNPDILCNREIKFKVFLEKALELGGDFLATGHYCQIGQKDGHYQLLKGVDPGKDQSYFLYTIKSHILEKVLFPIGVMHKTDLRDFARKHGVATAEKKDSTGICFIGKRNFKEFLHKYVAYTPGNFERLNGEVIGKHDGVAFYTIGQRKGLDIGGPGDAWYVVGKDVPRNVVYIEQGANHPALFRDSLHADELSWVSPKGAPPLPFHCSAKVRYRQQEQPCIIQEITPEGIAYVEFLAPQRAVTPRQSVVFYDGEVCLGGGMIRDL